MNGESPRSEPVANQIYRCRCEHTGHGKIRDGVLLLPLLCNQCVTDSYQPLLEQADQYRGALRQALDSMGQMLAGDADAGRVREWMQVTEETYFANREGGKSEHADH